MFEEPSSYWEPFRKRIEISRLEEHWLVQGAAATVWISFWITGAVSLFGLWRIAFPT
jgi:hypothetical protein